MADSFELSGGGAAAGVCAPALRAVIETKKKAASGKLLL